MVCRILVVDDSAAIPKVIRIAFSKYEVDVRAAASHVEALSELQEQKADLLIVDAGMFDQNIVDELQRIQRHADDAPCILLSGSHEKLDTDALERASFRHMLRKPFEASDITGLAERVLGERLQKMEFKEESASNSSAAAAGSSQPAQEGQSFPPPPPPPGIQLNDAGRVGKPAFDLAAERGRGTGVVAQTEEDWFTPPPPPMGAPVARDAEAPTFSPPPPPPPVDRSPQTGLRSGMPPMDASPTPSPGLDLSELEGMVRQLVEEYCAKHFSPLAREVITSEIRRLTEERSRHLIDN